MFIEGTVQESQSTTQQKARTATGNWEECKGNKATVWCKVGVLPSSSKKTEQYRQCSLGETNCPLNFSFLPSSRSPKVELLHHRKGQHNRVVEGLGRVGID